MAGGSARAPAAPPPLGAPAAARPSAVPAAPASSTGAAVPPHLAPAALDAPAGASAAMAAPVVMALPGRAPAALAPLAPRVAPSAATPAPAPGGTGRPGSPLPGPGRDPLADFPHEGPRTLVGFLVSFDSVELGQYWPLHQGRNVIGRQGAATGLDVEISHPTTSSLHAVLLATARPGRVMVEDTNSTNGTFVNDNVLAPGQRWELRDGDRVRFGLFDTIIKIVDKT